MLRRKKSSVGRAAGVLALSRSGKSEQARSNMSRHRELVDGLERMDRQSVGDFGERASLSSGHVDLRGLQEEDFEDDYARDFLKSDSKLESGGGGTNEALLDADHSHLHSTDEHVETQGRFSKAFYNAFGLKWYNKVFNRNLPLGPQMYRFHNIGLYAHYAVRFALSCCWISRQPGQLTLPTPIHPPSHTRFHRPGRRSVWRH